MDFASFNGSTWSGYNPLTVLWMSQSLRYSPWVAWLAPELGEHLRSFQWAFASGFASLITFVYSPRLRAFAGKRLLKALEQKASWNPHAMATQQQSLGWNHQGNPNHYGMVMATPDWNPQQHMGWPNPGTVQPLAPPQPTPTLALPNYGPFGGTHYGGYGVQGGNQNNNDLLLQWCLLNAQKAETQVRPRLQLVN